MTPYLLKEAFLAKTHNLKHLTRHTNAVGIYHCSLLCSHSQISVRTDGRKDGRTDGRTNQVRNPPAHAPRVNKVMLQYGGSLTFNVTVILCGSIVLTTVLLYLQIKNI